MKCPHCLVEFHDDPCSSWIGRDVDGVWGVTTRSCPACKRMSAWLATGVSAGGRFHPTEDGRLIRPRGIARAPLAPDVPEDFARDYHEACLVLADSPKASAALSRRCLQHLLRQKAGAAKRDLADQIQELLDSKQLPPYLASDLDAVRNTGNFAAHPMKSTATGEIMDVEPGEAEWNLDVLEALFEFYFVQPAAAQAKRDALNAKLTEAGKPPMRTG